MGTEGKIGRALAIGLAKKWGLTSGYLFRDTDPMHFGTDMQSPQQVIENQRRVTEAGGAAYNSSDVVSRRLEENQRKQETLNASIKALQDKYNEKAAQIEDPAGAELQMATIKEQIAHQQELLTAVKGARTEIMSTQEAAAKAAENTNKALVGEVGAQRDLNGARERMRQLGESAGTGVDQAALFRVESAELAKLTIQFNDSITAIDLQTQALARQSPAMEKGGQAAEFAANAEKAMEDARKTSLPNTDERIRQIKVETEALNAQTLAKRDNQAAQSIAKSNEQIEMIKVETSPHHGLDGGA